MSAQQYYHTCAKGVLNTLSKYNIPEIQIKQSYRKTEVTLNNWIKQFFIHINIENKWVKNNSPKYKGYFSPFASNCAEVQEHWKDFKSWLNSNYTLK